jgi:hypothetical protein
MSNDPYVGYWHSASDQEPCSDGNYRVLAQVDSPCYSFQGRVSTGLNGSRGLWASYHFPSGNYDDPDGTPTHAEVHGERVAGKLPGHQKRVVDSEPSSTEANTSIGELLIRPQSALSRAMVKDSIRCITDSCRSETILSLASGGETLLGLPNREELVKRFGLLLLGARAHVIADTWAQEDFCAVNNVANSY